MKALLSAIALVFLAAACGDDASKKGTATGTGAGTGTGTGTATPAPAPAEKKK